MLGLGKGRFRRLRRAVMNGAETCPYDGRFVPKGKQPPSEKRARVYQFLTQLYVESAEPIPDGLNSNKSAPGQASTKSTQRSWTDPRSSTCHLGPSMTTTACVNPKCPKSKCQGSCFVQRLASHGKFVLWWEGRGKLWSKKSWSFLAAGLAGRLQGKAPHPLVESPCEVQPVHPASPHNQAVGPLRAGQEGAGA